MIREKISKMKAKPVIFYDGICIFCDAFIRFVINRDKGRFNLCFLQSESVRKFNLEIDQRNLTTLILLENQRVFKKSTAVIKIMCSLGGFWKIAILLMLIPCFIRDFFYDIFGKNRYRIFGKKMICEANSDEIKKRLIQDF